MNLTPILAPQLRPNLLPAFCDFDTTDIWNKTVGGSQVSVVSSNVNPYEGIKNARITFNYIGASLICEFTSSGSQMQYTVQKDGDYAISFMLSEISIGKNTLGVILKVFKNGNALEFGSLFGLDNELKSGYNKLSQTLSLVQGDVINFSFTLTSDVQRTVDIDALKLELINDSIYLPSAYSKTPYDKMAWHRKEDFVSSQVIPANTSTKLNFTGNQRKSNDVELIDSTLKIVPKRLLSNIGINALFSTPTPSGTNQNVSIELKCNGISYRTTIHHFSKATSVIDYIDFSFLLPVEEDFLQYGGEIFITSTSEITISNRYLYVNQISN